uniref:Proepiregulin n=1 Tax=Salvator merianae TaxID=96440 RepID=A0A8D0DWG4_SALMN
MASGSTQKLEGVFLLMGLYLFQAVLGTTVIPLCGRNETDNCTTALVRTGNSQRMVQMGITTCKPEMQNYCFKGQCMYVVDLNEYICRCDAGYFGVRCGHSNLNSVIQPLSKEYVALSILLSLFLLAAIALAIYFFYNWYQNKKRRRAASRNYQEVTTDAEKDNKLLQV